MRTFLFSAALAFSLPLVAIPAHADTYQYSISYSYGIGSASAVFDESSIISSSGDTTVDAPFISSSYDIPLFPGPLTSVIVDPLDTSYCTGPFDSCVFLDGSTPGLGAGLFFSAVSITSVGTYYDVNGNGTLTITDLSATPEPPSLILLLTGVVGAGATLHRRVRSGSLAG